MAGLDVNGVNADGDRAKIRNLAADRGVGANLAQQIGYGCSVRQYDLRSRPKRLFQDSKDQQMNAHRSKKNTALGC